MRHIAAPVSRWRAVTSDARSQRLRPARMRSNTPRHEGGGRRFKSHSLVPCVTVPPLAVFSLLADSAAFFTATVCWRRVAVMCLC